MNKPTPQITDENALEWMSASLDGMLTADESAALQAYIERTPGAQAELDDMQAVIGHLSDLPEVAPPVDLYQRVRAEIDAESEPSQPAMYSITPWLRRAAGIAAVLLVARVGYHELQQEKAPRDVKAVLGSAETLNDEMSAHGAPEARKEALPVEVVDHIKAKATQNAESPETSEARSQAPKVQTAPAAALPAPVLEGEADIALGATRQVDLLKDMEAGERFAAPTSDLAGSGSVAKTVTENQPIATPRTPIRPSVVGSPDAVPAIPEDLESQTGKVVGHKAPRPADDSDEGARNREMPVTATSRPKPIHDVDSEEIAPEPNEDRGGGQSVVGGGFGTDHRGNAPADLQRLDEAVREEAPKGAVATPETRRSDKKTARRISGASPGERDGAIWKQNAAEDLSKLSWDDDLDTVSVSEVALGDTAVAHTRDADSPAEPTAEAQAEAQEEARRDAIVLPRPPPRVLPQGSTSPGLATERDALTIDHAAKDRVAFTTVLPRQNAPSRKDATNLLLDHDYEEKNAFEVASEMRLGAANYTAVDINGTLKNETPDDALRTKAETADTLTLIGTDKDAHPMRIQAPIAEVDALIAEFSTAAKEKKLKRAERERPARLAASVSDGIERPAAPGRPLSEPHPAGKALRVFSIDRDDYDAFMAALAKIGDIEAKPAAPAPATGWFFFKQSDGGTLKIYLMVEPPVSAETEPKTE